MFASTPQSDTVGDTTHRTLRIASFNHIKNGAEPGLVTQALRKLEWEASLDYRVSSRLAWATE